jgi:hypothetical protein
MRVERIPFDEGGLVSELPRCGGKVCAATRHWRHVERRTDLTCTMPAHYVIDGTPYCERHGGSVVLRHVLNNGGTI